MVDRGRRRREGNHIAEVFADGKDGEGGAVALGEPVAVELVVGEAGRLEVGVVENRPLDAGGGDVAGHPRIPDPFGHPHAGHLRLEPAFEPLRRQSNLADAITGRQHREHRLIERAADDFNLAFGDQTGHAVEVVGMVTVEPLHQRTAGVEGQPNAGMTFEQFQQRQVAVVVGLFDDPIEVADWLVVMEDEDEPNGRRHGGNRRWR